MLFKIAIPNVGYGCLTRLFAVFHVEVHDIVHALDNFTEGSKALRVQAGAIVPEIDE